MVFGSLQEHTQCWAEEFANDPTAITRKQIREIEHLGAKLANRLSEIDIAWDMAWSAVRGSVKAEDRDFSWSFALDAAWPALLTLVLYDDCKHYLSSDHNELKILNALGDDRAIMFYYATKVLKETNVIEVN